MSPTQRSLKYLRDRGYIAEIAEHRVPRINITRDLFGFIDIAVLDGKPGMLGVQTTTMSNHAARIAKIRSDELAKTVNAWLLAGNRIVVHGWAKRGARGQRKRWTLTETEIPELASAQARDVEQQVDREDE